MRPESRRLLCFAAALTAAATAIVSWGCGGSGDGGGDGDEEEDGGGVIDTGAKDVSGSFYLGSLDRPAVGYELWLLDHTAPLVSRVPLDESGGFSAPLASFAEQHIYSMHLVRDFVLVADIDLSDDNAGAQTAFVYEGGYGFDLGKVVVPLDARGLVDVGTQGEPVGTVGGGFALRTATAAGLASFPGPTGVSQYAVASRLYVFDPRTVLAAFYQRDVNPELYARELPRLSRVGGVLASVAEGSFTAAHVTDGGSWLLQARRPAGDDASPETSALWTDTKLAFDAAGANSWQFNVYAGSVPAVGAILLLKAKPKEGEQVTVPKMLDLVLGLPPRLVGYGSSGGAVAAVDYASATDDNGLTRPFCQKDAVSLELAPPKDLADVPLPRSRWRQLDFEIDYYKRVAGRTIRIAATAEMFTAPYNAALEQPAATGVTRAWDPAKQRLRFTYADEATVGATQTVELPSAYFPFSLGGDDVFKARLRVYYRDDDSPLEGAVAVWLDTDC